MNLAECGYMQIMHYLIYVPTYSITVDRFLIAMHMSPDLPKGSYTHTVSKHILSPFVSYINGPTAHVFNTAEG